MENQIKVLLLDAGSGFYRIKRYPIGEFFGPVDMGLHLSKIHNSLNIGTGLLAGSIFPGSNRLIFTGFSPCWGGFYISSMGGAGLVFDNLGINLLSIIGKSSSPSILYLNRSHGEEIELEIDPVDMKKIWGEGRKGIYSLIDYTYEKYKGRYKNDPRVLATGPASEISDIGGIASVPIVKGEVTYVDTWAGRGGFGTKLLRDHGIVAVIYGGTFIDEDFRDRNVADKWFEEKYKQKLAAKDFEATTKYRFDPNFDTGGTFGVNYATVGGGLIAFNYRSIYFSEADRLKIHKDFIAGHYLKQFNDETIKTKQQKTCGEPCSAVCKKMNNEYKKDYEPYQTLGPLCGIFDQRAAELLNHHADMYGFDAISVGGILSWLMECLSEGLLTPQDLSVSGVPVFTMENFDLEKDSMRNARIGVEILDSIIMKRGILDFFKGPRRLARFLGKTRDMKIRDKFMYNSYGRNGWMVPNQYWTPGVLSPMPIMGKYYMHYGTEFVPPRELGKKNAERLFKELMLDNMGICRFHRKWAEEMVPDIIESLYGMKDSFLECLKGTVNRILSLNSSIFWEGDRNIDFIHAYLTRQRDVEKNDNPLLKEWIEQFDSDRKKAAFDYWYEIHKGIHESLLIYTDDKN